LSSSPRRTLWLACLFLLALASPAWAQKKRLALEDLTADPPLSGRGVTGLAWLPDGRHFSYIVRQGSGEEALSELVVEDARTGQKTQAVTAQGETPESDPRGIPLVAGPAGSSPVRGERSLALSGGRLPYGVTTSLMTRFRTR
jgi:hypothetical protein